MTPPVTKAGYAYLQGTLKAPHDSQAAYATIGRVRSAVHAIPGASAVVGGTTATLWTGTAQTRMTVISSSR